jgi:outer membrane receptor for ferrienterochelin and colicins
MSKGTFFGLALICITITSWAVDSAPSFEKPIEAPELSLDQLMKLEVPIVEAASKYKQKITEAPASVTVIGSDEVKRYGHRTLADVLQSVPGFYVSYDRDYSFLGIRGFNPGDYNSRVLLMVDGHRINNSLSDGAPIGTEFLLDVDLIERVEIIRGPGSSLYGNNAFLGVINVITRKGADMNGIGGEVSGEIASFDTYKARVTYGHKFTNDLELFFSGSIYDSAGQKDLFYKEFATPENNNGFAHKADDDAFKSFFGSIAYHGFTLEGGYITREKGDPTALNFTEFNNARLRTIDERGYADLKYAHEFTGLFDLAARLYYDRQEFEAGYPYPTVFYKEFQLGEWWGTEVQLTKRLWDQHTLSFGGEYRNDFRQQDRIVDADTGDLVSSSHRDRQNYGIYLEGDFAVVTNLHLNAGVRYDQYGDFDPTFNPRVALIYNPIGQTIFKALYGTAFRAPNFYELSDPRFQDIQPETITTYELVYEQGIGNNLRSSVSGFFNQIDDLIVFQDQRYQNLEGADAKGVELALDGLWAGGLRGRASYTFQETRDRSTDRVLPDSPKHLARFNLSVPLLKEKIFASVELQTVSQRSSLHLGTETPGANAGAYGVINLTLFSQNLVKGLDISASVYNVLDRKFSDPASQVHGRLHEQDTLQQDGRTFRVKLTYRF